MNNNVSIIVGGTGQFGITLAEKLIKKNKVIITTRSIKKSKKRFNHLKKNKTHKIKYIK